MSKNEKPCFTAIASERTMILETAVEDKIRVIVFHTCPKARQTLVSMYIPVYADDEEVCWKWTTVFGDDFMRMIGEISPIWTKSDDCPLEAYYPLEDDFIGVARYILGADESDKINYLDGDCFNLRRDNLAIAKQMAPATASPGSKAGAIELPGVLSGKRTLH
jgi:hypothetical protein